MVSMGLHVAFTHPFLSVVSTHLEVAIQRMVEHLADLGQLPVTVQSVKYLANGVKEK